MNRWLSLIVAGLVVSSCNQELPIDPTATVMLTTAATAVSIAETSTPTFAASPTPISEVDAPLVEIALQVEDLQEGYQLLPENTGFFDYDRLLQTSPKTAEFLQVEGDFRVYIASFQHPSMFQSTVTIGNWVIVFGSEEAAQSYMENVPNLTSSSLQLEEIEFEQFGEDSIVYYDDGKRGDLHFDNYFVLIRREHVVTSLIYTAAFEQANLDELTEYAKILEANLDTVDPLP